MHAAEILVANHVDEWPASAVSCKSQLIFYVLDDPIPYWSIDIVRCALEVSGFYSLSAIICSGLEHVALGHLTFSALLALSSISGMLCLGIVRFLYWSLIFRLMFRLYVLKYEFTRPHGLEETLCVGNIYVHINRYECNLHRD
jgi:hypothetical protein